VSPELSFNSCYRLRPAQPTHSSVSGIIISRLTGIGSPHPVHNPNSGFSIMSRDLFSFTSLISALCSDASTMLLLLIASMRVMRPIAFSGATGFELFFKAIILFFNKSISCRICLRSFSLFSCSIVDSFMAERGCQNSIEAVLIPLTIDIRNYSMKGVNINSLFLIFYVCMR